MDAARYVASGADPLHATRSREMLEKVRAASEAEPDFWTRRIREGLLNNPHRLRITFHPDPEHAAREDERERPNWPTLRATLSPDELRTLTRAHKAAKPLRTSPNSPEALATLPR
jgi:Zn-dependent M16 (insulinase) family peptidase